jgi:hypothetical protein
VIVVLLVALAAYYAWRQVQSLRRLREQTDLPREDQLFYRTQAWRRLANSALMILLAGLLVGSYVLGQEQRAGELSRADRVAAADEGAAPPTAEQREFLNHYGTFWMVFVLILLVVMGVAFWDLWATRRFGLRHYRQIQADRLAMIRHELARFRSERNGH